MRNNLTFGVVHHIELADGRRFYCIELKRTWKGSYGAMGFDAWAESTMIPRTLPWVETPRDEIPEAYRAAGSVTV